MTTWGSQDKDSAPKDARQIRSRKALSGAMLALLEEKPFDQITIRDISAKSTTGYATFFRHFPTKEALLSSVAQEEISGLLAMTVPILTDANSLESSRALCRYVNHRRKLWAALLTGGAAGIVREEFIRQARDLAQGFSMQAWLPADLGVVHGTGGTFDLLAWWLSQDQDAYSPEQIADILNRLIIAPLVGKYGVPTPVDA